MEARCPSSIAGLTARRPPKSRAGWRAASKLIPGLNKSPSQLIETRAELIDSEDGHAGVGFADRVDKAGRARGGKRIAKSLGLLEQCIVGPVEQRLIVLR
jgi:hypothetical protein